MIIKNIAIMLGDSVVSYGTIIDERELRLKELEIKSYYDKLKGDLKK